MPTPPRRERPALPSAVAIVAVAAIALGAILLGAGAARADVVVLKNGNEIQGEVLEANDERLVVRFPGGVIRLWRKDVAEVRSQKRTTYLIEVGEKQLLRKSYPEAIETFRSGLRESPDSEELARRLAEARGRYAAHLGELRRFAEALALYRELAKERPGDESIVEEIHAIDAERRDGLREEERALAELTSGDVETGVWRCRKVFDSFPDRRAAIAGPLADGLARQAKALRAKGRLADAIEELDSALAVSPTAVDRVRDLYVECTLELVPAHAQQGEFEHVGKLAARALEIAPTDTALRFFYGLSKEGSGDALGAAELYASILGERSPQPEQASRVVDTLRRRAEADVAATRPKLASVRAQLAAEVLPGEWRTLTTTHFTILHRNEHIGREVALVAEHAYTELFRVLECTTHWQSRCTIQIFPAKDEYLATVGLGEWSGAAHRLDSRRGALSEHRIYTYQGQPRLADGLLRHELAHALLVHRLNYPQSVPLWANEGFAVAVEPAYMHQHYDRIAAEALAREALIPLDDLLEKTSYPDADVDLFYAQSQSLVRYLLGRKGGLPRFVEFLRDVSSSGVPLATALERHYRFASLLALENRWRAALTYGTPASPDDRR